MRSVSGVRRSLRSLGTLNHGSIHRLPYLEGTRPLVRFCPTLQSRAFGLSFVRGILLPPVVFGGLMITLWAYKCVMMIVFQNKIIYMPSIPPFSRSEKVDDYAVQCRPVVWREHDIEAADGTTVKLLEGNVDTINPDTKEQVVVLYFQGNASSLPPRLPYLSAILKSVQASNPHSRDAVKYTIFALSYRGFWTSGGRPTQAGIELDSQAALTWLSQNVLRDPQINTNLVLWGQSIGAGVATTALATLLTQQDRDAKALFPQQPAKIRSLILETPFLSIRSMLTTLYPQKFLPYRYLWPFLRSTWDSEAAIKEIAAVARSTRQESKPNNTVDNTTELPIVKKILILQAGKDEIVPAEQSEALERVCRENLGGGVEVERMIIAGALHTEVMAKPQGRAAVVQHLREAAGVGVHSACSGVLMVG